MAIQAAEAVKWTPNAVYLKRNTNVLALNNNTVPMTSGAKKPSDSQASCQVCKGDCGDYSNVKKGYPRYNVAAKECLVAVPKELKGYKTKDIDVFLKPEVLQKFQEMSAAYKKTHKNQELLLNAGFRDKKGQEAMVRMYPSLAAPVGYTEHHTGCAVDIKDAAEGSERYNWLMKHGKEYGFELSYPQNNSQGVTPESWHWRYNANLKNKMI